MCIIQYGKGLTLEKYAPWKNMDVLKKKNSIF